VKFSLAEEIAIAYRCRWYILLSLPIRFKKKENWATKVLKIFPRRHQVTSDILRRSFSLQDYAMRNKVAIVLPLRLSGARACTCTGWLVTKKREYVAGICTLIFKHFANEICEIFLHLKFLILGKIFTCICFFTNLSCHIHVNNKT